MKLKILRRSITCWNIILFQILSLIFLYVIICLDKNISTFNWNYFTSYLDKYSYMFILLLLTNWFTLKYSRASKKTFLLFFVIIFVNSLTLVSKNYSKGIFLMVLIFSIIFFHLYLIWEEKLSKAAFNPNFSINDLYPFPKYMLESKIKHNEEETINGFLTNWDENSCFIRPLVPLNLKVLSGTVEVDIMFQEKSFLNKGLICSFLKDESGIIGIGIIFKINYQKESLGLNWNNLHWIFTDLGYSQNI